MKKHLLCGFIVLLTVFNLSLSTPLRAQSTDRAIYWSSSEEAKIYRGFLLDRSVEEVFAASYPTAVAVTESNVYWADLYGETIKRSTLNGDQDEVLVEEVRTISQLEVDADQGYIFWIEENVTENASLRRANIDGSNIITLVPDVRTFSGLTLDKQQKQVYWTTLDSIHRSSYEGADPELFVTGLGSLHTLTVDEDEGVVYWSDGDQISRVRTDGSDSATVFEDVQVIELALNSHDGLLYWGDISAVRRAPPEGGAVETVGTDLFREVTDLGFSDEHVYWVVGVIWGQPSIQRAVFDVGTSEKIILGHSRPAGIAVDTLSNQMYWVGQNGELTRADLIGSDWEVLHYFTCGIGNLTDVAVDLENGKVYWAYFGDCPRHDLLRANLDGTEVEDNVLFGAITDPRYLAIPPDGSLIYWTDRTDILGLHYSTPNGDQRGLISEIPTEGIAVDMQHHMIYWTTGSDGQVQRANLDGSEIEEILSGLEHPTDIALDVREGKMYWAERDAGMIRRANLDGSEIEDLFTGLQTPEYFALTFENATVVSSEPLPSEVALTLQNYPNPVRGQTAITFTVSSPSHVTLDVYDTLGRKMEVLLDSPLPSGDHRVLFDASGLTTGVYFYQLTTGAQTITNQMVVLR